MSKTLHSLKTVLYGDSENEPVPEMVAQLAQELYNHEVLPALIGNLSKLEFESRKDVVQIFNSILRRQIGTRFPTVDYIMANNSCIFTLIHGYQNQEISLNCGMMLRECIKHEAIAKMILLSENFFIFFELVEMSTFDISSDAFATFKDLLTRHKTIVPQFLEENFEKEADV